MRFEHTSRLLTKYFYTHPFPLSFFKCSQVVGQGCRAFESYAVTEGVVLECQSIFIFESLYFVL